MTTRIKRITGFHHTPQGLFLDYEDQPGAVAVHPGTGDILLDEGEGKDRYHGAAIPRSAHPRFTVTCAPTDPEAELKLEFGSQIHSLGTTTQSTEAATWAKIANDAIAANDPQQLRERTRPVGEFAQCLKYHTDELASLLDGITLKYSSETGLEREGHAKMSGIFRCRNEEIPLVIGDLLPPIRALAKSFVISLGGREAAIEAITRAADELETGEQSAAVAD